MAGKYNAALGAKAWPVEPSWAVLIGISAIWAAVRGSDVQLAGGSTMSIARRLTHSSAA